MVLGKVTPMPFDDDADDERPDQGVPLPPEDRLWRHPSELSGGSPQGTSASDPLNTPWPPLAALPTETAPRHRPLATIAAVSCLAGAVIALGAVLITRPEQGRGGPAPKTLTRAATSVVFRPVDTFSAEQVATEVSPSVARLDVESATGWKIGSAVLLYTDGSLLTSADLVEGSTELVVTFDDGRPRAARLAGTDPQTGLAVVNVAVQKRPAVRVADHRPVLGELTAMVGGPGPASNDGTVTTGVVRGLGRQLDQRHGTLHDMIEADRPVLSDTVGGALVDRTGSVLGICLRGKEGELGYAVPIDVARKVADSIRGDGKVRWAHLGVHGVDLDPGRARDLALPGGAVLKQVDANSPAANAGLSTGDIVVGLGLERIDSIGALVRALRSHDPGEQVAVAFLRGTDSRRVDVTLTSG